MGLGNFINGGKGYEINTPRTPSTWTNYLCNDEYHAEISQTLQGKSSMVENYVQKSFTTGYRYFYILEHNSGEVWNPNYIPLRREYDNYSCIDGLNSTELISEKNGIKSKVRVFVPVKGYHEVWSVSLSNLTKEAKELSVFSAFGLSDHGVMGGECVYDKENNILYKYAFPYHTFYEEKEKVENEPSYYYMVSDTNPVSWDMSQRRFFGCDDLGGIPKAVENGSCSNIIGEAENFCATFQHKYVIQPGETVTFNLEIGVASSVEQIVRIKKSFTAQSVENELKMSDAHWDKVCQRFMIKTPDQNLNHLVNYWLKKQVTLLTRLNRSSTYCPIRNQLQDAMGYAMIDPEGAKEYMFKVLALQRNNGFIKQWHMTDGSPARGLCLINHTDGPLWLVICLALLIHQNGDAAILDEKISYLDGGEDTVYQHLLKAIEYMANRLGEHGLCLIGDGDWNDPINGVGRLGKGESTWSSLALIYCIDSMNEFTEVKADQAAKDTLDQLRDKLDKAINTWCWSGNWYVAGFDDYGVAIGSPEDNDRVFLNAQTWAIMTRTAREDRLVAVMKTMDRINTPFGPLLIDPPFHEWNARWGRVSVKKSGTTENGSVYCHASMFKAFSDSVRGDGNDLYDVIARTLPTNPDNPPEKNLQLPLFVSNYYYGLKDSANYGRSSGHYGTGTVAWLLMAVVEELLGVKSTMNGIEIKPCLPEAWKEVSCERTFKDACYKIHMTPGKKGIKVNGTLIEGTVLPYQPGESYTVEVSY